ncbi:natural killer cell receptor 2B4-like isoform X1 [Erpetoichthys calabaricus]|uniref:natural killer cell receptor 2B4-like isoform X1 n=1 Tax=Erpetoichthys calabaricus TaxID=27687 RepID=UPI002234BD49|nr:natural killer cell receptor 2B4-like isoform X1 [Erpetoichthys calabaricus]
MKRLKLFRATLAFLIICALHFINGKTITAIVNESVVLPSGVPSDFHPTDIQWSLFSNVTLIATLISGKIRDDWYEQFKNRLKLHTNNASLEILQLRTQDSMTYYVSAFNHSSPEHKSEITLIVYDKLQPPKLEVLQTSNENSECTFKFECSVQQVKNVDYFWNAMSTNVTWKENAPSLENRTSVLKISQVPVNLNVTYNCKVSNNMTNASATMSVSCIAITYDSHRHQTLLIIAFFFVLFVIICSFMFVSKKRSKDQLEIKSKKDHFYMSCNSFCTNCSVSYCYENEHNLNLEGLAVKTLD